MNKNNVLVGLVVISLILGGWALLKKPSTQVIKETVEKLGSIPGDEINGDRFCVGGVCTYRYTRSLATGTTTVCSIPVPRNGRSSVLTLAAIDIRTATGTAWTWRIGTSTTGYSAVTTILGSKAMTNADSIVYIASSTAQATTFAGTGLFGTTTPQFINFDLGGTAILPVSPVIQGSCSANFTEI